ncbi:hypothetical protein MSG28_015271 [Choristoneura fumiferana]|uniref:Uncharacterized protein n=2 Tax=Choristoneura fumiferana TaxID=7141 RepID=A0ACC0KA00_CHOFU|nr:hypothetical protein MSG28_015271 [Choristoneura fumiferana]
MDLVKEEAAWEAEYVEALWEALYAVHHEARSQATDLASPVARACDAKTRDPQPKTETPDPGGVSASHSTIKDTSTNIPTKTKPAQGVQDIPTRSEEAGIANSARTLEPVPTNVFNQDSSSSNNHNTEVTRNPKDVSNTILEDATNKMCKTEPAWAPQDDPNILEDAILTNVVRTPAPTGDVSTNQPSLEDSSSNNPNATVSQKPNIFVNTHSILVDATNKMCKTEPAWAPQDDPNILEDAILTNVVRTPAPTGDVSTNQPSLEDSSSNNPNATVTQKPNNFVNTHSILEEATNKMCKTEPVCAQDISNSLEDGSVPDIVRTPASSVDVSTTYNSTIYNTDLARNSAEVPSSVEDSSSKMCKNLGIISPNLEDTSNNMPNKKAVQNADVSVTNSDDGDADVNRTARTDCNPEGISSLRDSISIKTSNYAPKISDSEVSRLQTPSVSNGTAVPKTELISLTPCYVKLEHVSYKKAFICQICQRCFSYKHRLMNHILSHTQSELNTIKIEKKIKRKGKFVCHICGNGVKSKRSLTSHLKIHERDPFREQMNRKTPKDIITKIYYTCDYCGMSTIRKYCLIKHMKRHAKEQAVACEICHQQFQAAWEYVDHMKRKTCKPYKSSSEHTNKNNLQNLMVKPCYVSLERIDIGNEVKTAKIKIIDEFKSFNSDSEDLLDDNQTFETDEETYYCGVCEEQFDTLSSLGDHVCHHPKKPVSCDICKKKFRFQNDLVAHVRLHTGEKPYICDVCKKQFRLKHTMSMHIRTMHLGEHPFSCKVCKKKFRTSQALGKHVRKHTGEKEKKLYSCKVCKKRFRFERECVEHGRVHTGEKPFRCTFCNMSFRVEVSLRIHSRVHTGEKPYTCDVCKRSFRIWQTLDAHKRVHTGEKPFPCDVCNKQFRRYDTLYTHKRTHTGEKPYACEFCPKRFTQRSHLKTHQRTHTGEKPYSCSVCNKRFRDNSHLRNHARTHSAERPYPCNFCEKFFKNTQDLKIHHRIHTGQKPYECKVCKKKCTQASNLRTHMKTHGKKSWLFSCNVCEKKFQRRQYLNQHLTLHGAHTPFMCDVCGAQFSSSSVLSVHARSHYGGE